MEESKVIVPSGLVGEYPHVPALYRLLLVGSADRGGSVFSILCVVLSIPWALDLEMERVSSGNEIF